MEEQMKRHLSGKDKDDCDSEDELEPFAPNIVTATYPIGFRMPHLSKFDGDGDPSNQLRMFNTIMMAHNVRLDLRCSLFLATLFGLARQWFKQYKRHSISSWKKFSSDFKKAFRASQSARVDTNSLAKVKQ